MPTPRRAVYADAFAIIDAMLIFGYADAAVIVA